VILPLNGRIESSNLSEPIVLRFYEGYRLRSPPTHETHKLTNNEITLFTAIELEIGAVIDWMRKEEAASERPPAEDR